MKRDGPSVGGEGLHDGAADAAAAAGDERDPRPAPPSPREPGRARLRAAGVEARAHDAARDAHAVDERTDSGWWCVRPRSPAGRARSRSGSPRRAARTTTALSASKRALRKARWPRPGGACRGESPSARRRAAGRRPRRWPRTTAGWRRAAPATISANRWSRVPSTRSAPPRAASSSTGISSGRCWPSASTVTTASQPRANSARNAVTSAAPLPRLTGCVTTSAPARARRLRRPVRRAVVHDENVGQHARACGGRRRRRTPPACNAGMATAIRITAAPAPARRRGAAAGEAGHEHEARGGQRSAGVRDQARAAGSNVSNPAVGPNSAPAVARTAAASWRAAVLRGHGLGREDRREGSRAPHRVQGVGLQPVARHRARRAGDDEVDVARGEAGAVEHRGAAARDSGSWPRPQETRDALGSNPLPQARTRARIRRAARACRRFVLHHDHRRSLAHEKAGTAPVEGTRRLASVRARDGSARRSGRAERARGAATRPPPPPARAPPSPRRRRRRRGRARAAARLRAASP